MASQIFYYLSGRKFVKKRLQNKTGFFQAQNIFEKHIKSHISYVLMA